MPASASFNPENFDELIQNHGYNAIWKQSIVCECMEEGQPHIHCKLCNGSGYRYIRSVHIKVVSTSFSGNQTLKIEGLSEPGQVYITPQRDAILAYHDKLEFYEVICKHSQVLIMGDRRTSSTYRPIQKVSFVLIGDQIFEENIDFIVEENKHHLLWINDKTKPNKGDRISVLYLTNPEYMVKDMAHELRSVRQNKGTHTPYTVDMPNQYIVKRMDFVYGETVNKKKDDEKVENPLEDSEFTYE